MRYLSDYQPYGTSGFSLSAGAQLIVGASKRDHTTPLLRQLHWLRAERRNIFKVVMLAYQCIREVAPSYLSDSLHVVADIPGRSRLRSASILELVVPLTRQCTAGDRSFLVAAAKTWNKLLQNVTKATSFLSFWKTQDSSLLYTPLLVICQFISFFLYLHMPSI
jgi:hypothetical protein